MSPSFLSWRTSDDTAVVTRIIDYMENGLFLPAINWPKEEFEERSYARWAADDILQRIMDNPLFPPDLIIEMYKLEMAAYAELNEEIRMFAIAVSTADELLTVIK